MKPLWSCLIVIGALPIAALHAERAQQNYSVFIPRDRAVSDTRHQDTSRADAHVSLSVKDSTIEYVIAELTRQAHLQPVYDESDALRKRITVKVSDMNVMDALATVLRGTGLRAKLASNGEMVMIRRAAKNESGRSEVEKGSIRGQVIDSVTKRGLTGAAVHVQGLKVSAIAGDSGRFVIPDVPVGDQLLSIRLFGYRPATRAVTVTSDAEAIVRIGLVSAPTVLSSVVTTATGVQQRREVGNDIITLNVDSLRQVAPITSVTDLLDSRVPGLTVQRTSGIPGDPARIRLRGPKSITGSNDPIVIVDGIRVYAAQSDQRTANLARSVVPSQANSTMLPTNYAAPSPLDQIDPNTIETIEVMKGPSASSLYGSDAANGVIIITTRRGRAGPTHWGLTGGSGISMLPGSYPTQTVRWGHHALTSRSVPCAITERNCNVFDSVTHIQLANIPRWSPFGRGHSANGSLNISGGTSVVTYSLTGSASNTMGYLRLPPAFQDAFEQFHGFEAPEWAKHPNQYTTWGGGGQLTAQASPTLQVNLQSNIFHGTQRHSSLEQVVPLLFGAVDSACVGCVGGQGGDLAIAQANAYEEATDEQLRFTNALTVAWTPWSWLPLSARAGLDITTGHDVSLLRRNFVPYIPGGCSDCVDTSGHYGLAEKRETFKTLAVSSRIPGWRGRLQTTIGFDVYSPSSLDVTADTQALGLGVTEPAAIGPAFQTVTGTTTFGWFLEPRVMLSERFFLTPGFRLDGGTANGGRAAVSGLPAKLTFASLFPKLDLSWIAINRDPGDRPVLGAITLLRPRVAIGSAGVQPSPGDQLRLLSESGGDTLRISTLGNTRLRPERSSEVEGGFELALWEGRMTADVTHARQMRHDAIISVPVAPSVFGQGQSISLNIGEVRNTSTELSATVQPISTSAVNWTVGGSWSRNNNVVLRLNQTNNAIFSTSDGRFFNGTALDGADGSVIAVGYPLFGRWARPIVGYHDDNGNGIIDQNEIRVGDTVAYRGRTDPSNTASLTTDLTLLHGRLGIHANVSHEGGNAQLNQASATAGAFLSVANDPSATFAQQANYVAAVTGQTYAGLIQTVSTWRLQSVSLNYELPASLARRFRGSHMSVALQGSNLKLWTNYRGKDPNVNGFPNGNASIDTGQLPMPRTWSLQFTLGN